MTWYWNLGLQSIKVIEYGAVRQTDRQTRWKQYQLSLLQLVQSRVFIVCRLERNMKMWVNTGIKLYTHCIATEAAVELGRSWIYPRITLSCLDHAVLSGGTGILIKTLFVLQYCVCISSLVPSVLHLSYGFQCSFFCGKTVHKSQTFPADVIYGQPLDITWPYNRWWWTYFVVTTQHTQRSRDASWLCAI